MNTYDIRRLALVLAIQTEVEGMKATNLERQNNGEALANPESSFVDAANNLRNLAYCHDEQI